MKRRWFSVAALAALGGCAAPAARYYRLAVVAGAVRGGAPVRVAVRGIGIPGYLDQSGIPELGGGVQFNSFANDLWAASLTDMLQGVMVQDLAQRLPVATVIESGGAVGVPADLLVEINVLRFDPDTAGRIVLNAQIAVRPAQQPGARVQSYAAAAAPASAAAADIVAAMSSLWAGTADAVAEMLTQPA